MAGWQLGEIEARFADIIWENEPLSSATLAKHGEELLGWKKSTTYTVLKRLCDKGLFRNEKGTVSAVVKREDFYARQTEQFVDDTFGGSLPAFLTAFTSRKTLTAAEVEALRKLVATYGGDSRE